MRVSRVSRALSTVYIGTVDDTAETTYAEPVEAAAMRKARIAEATYNLEQFKQIAKGVDAQHEMTAFRPEECIVFQSHTFVAYEFVTYFNVESYGEWVRDSKYHDVFRWHKQMLKHFSSTVRYLVSLVSLGCKATIPNIDRSQVGETMHIRVFVTLMD